MRAAEEYIEVANPRLHLLLLLLLLLSSLETCAALTKQLHKTYAVHTGKGHSCKKDTYNL
jgi:hypothetical protein